MTLVKRFLLPMVLLLALTQVAMAYKTLPRIITNPAGEAFAWAGKAYDVVEAFNTEKPVVADCTKFHHAYLDAKWCFASAANKAAFVEAIKSPDGNKFMPFGGGRCAGAISRGNMSVPGDPSTTIKIVDGKLMVWNSLKGQQASLASAESTQAFLHDAYLVWRLVNSLGAIED